MNADQRPIQWTMPKWAADLIRETIEMDSKSRAFDPELRQKLAKALAAVEEVDLP